MSAHPFGDVISDAFKASESRPSILGEPWAQVERPHPIETAVDKITELANKVAALEHELQDVTAERDHALSELKNFTEWLGRAGTVPERPAEKVKVERCGWCGRAQYQPGAALLHQADCFGWKQGLFTSKGHAVDDSQDGGK